MGKLGSDLPQLFTDEHLEAFRKLKAIPSPNGKGSPTRKASMPNDARKKQGARKN